MNEQDLQYVCTAIGNLSGIPIRLFRDDEIILYYQIVGLPKDPFFSHKDPIFAIKDHVGYYITSIFNYYGIVNFAPYRIVIGPSRQIPASEQELKELAFYTDVPPEETDIFVSAMRSIVNMPFESIIQMLCVVNFILNGEKLQLADVYISEEDLESLRSQAAESTFESDNQNLQATHNTMAIENAIMGIVEKGNTQALQEWADAAPAVRSGVLASTQLRQVKNTFIVTTTLAARAAIRGGLDSNDALTLSDLYIQKAEHMATENDIRNLQLRMIQDYTERVERVRLGGMTSRFITDVANYIQHHISEPITVDDISASLYVSRPYLSTKFKQEAGMTLTDFILQAKTDEAKRLLEHTNKSLPSIGAYLGFSSQSHFTKVFGKYAGCTPAEYRKTHT